MGQYVSYEDVRSKCGQISDVASGVNLVSNYLRYNYPSTVNEGQFSKEFQGVRADVEAVVADIHTYIAKYAEVLNSAALNYQKFDSELASVTKMVEQE